MSPQLRVQVLYFLKMRSGCFSYQLEWNGLIDLNADQLVFDGRVQIRWIEFIAVRLRVAQNQFGTEDTEYVTLGFQGRLESVHQEERGPLYHLTIPDVVHYGQRRKDYRVPVGLGLHGRVTLIATDGEAIEGRLCNLSQSGACVMFPVTAELAAEMRFDLCVIELPEVAPVQCSAEVRRVAEKNAPPELMAGLLFLDTDPQQRRQLRNSVAALERELIKKQSATPRR